MSSEYISRWGCSYKILCQSKMDDKKTSTDQERGRINTCIWSTTRFQEIGRKLKEQTPIWGCVRDLSELEESGCHCQFLIPGTPKLSIFNPTTCSNTKHAQHIACVAEHAALGESSSVEHSSRMMCRRLTVIAAVCVPHLAGQPSNRLFT